jgi:DNA polymerase III alpha subunit
MKVLGFLGILMGETYKVIKSISKKKLVGEKKEKLLGELREAWQREFGNTDNFQNVWNVISDAARYSFNGSHALAMAFDSLYEAWMKAHHRSVFYEVTLNHYQEKKDGKDKVAALIREACDMFGYKMGKFQYGADNSKFTVDDETKTIYPNLASVKGIGRKVVLDMLDISKRGYDNIADVYLAIKGTSINATIFRKLVKIGYFHEFGSSKQIMEQLEIVDYWKDRATIKKSQISELGLDGVDLNKYANDLLKSGKHSPAQWKDLDWRGLVKELIDRVPDQEYSFVKLAQNQYDVLKYCDMVDENMDKRFVLVMQLNTTYSPKFNAYRFKDGKIIPMKVHKGRNGKDVKASYDHEPFDDGDVLKIMREKDLPKRQNINGKWVPIPGEYEKWAKDYVVLQ